MIDPFTATTGAFDAIFTLVSIVVAVGFIAVIAIAVRNFAKAKSSGHDPFTLETDLATRVLDSELLAPAKSIEQRLAEIEDLAARGVISPEERQKARADVLAGR